MGGHDTLRKVWLFLKDSERLRGRKRQLSAGSDSENEYLSSLKRLRESLNLSDTCEQLIHILLRNMSGEERSYCETSNSSYSIEEKFGESSILEPLCSEIAREECEEGSYTIEEKFGESSIIEPSYSKMIEESFGESSILEPSSSKTIDEEYGLNLAGGEIELDLTGSIDGLCRQQDEHSTEFERKALIDESSINASRYMDASLVNVQYWDDNSW